jgi:phosphoglycerol transferase MdoB-like AlkP superfamily enzyme
MLLALDAALRIAWQVHHDGQLTKYVALDTANVVFRDFLLVFLLDILLVFRDTWLGLAKQPVLLPVYLFVIIDLILKILVIDFYRLPCSSLTIVSVASGLGKDLLFVGLAYLIAILTPSRGKSVVFIALYLAVVAINVVDTLYVYYASDHIESVLFDNINLAGIKGAMANWHPAYVIAAVAAVIAIVGASLRVLRGELPKMSLNFPVYFLTGLCLFLLGTAGLRAGALSINRHLENELPEFLKDTFDTRLQRYDLLATSPAMNLYAALNSYQCEAKQQGTIKPFYFYNVQERNYLEDAGFIHPQAPLPQSTSPSPYKTIVLIFFESLHAGYLHHYNAGVPADTTAFFDSLLAEYPHEDNYYTSASPTSFGLAATFLSHINFWYSYGVEKNPPSLFRLLQQQKNMEGYFITGASGSWGEQFILYPHLFGMQHFIDEEEMDKRYRGKSGWGYHDDVILAECLRLLRENRNNPKLIALKTQDLHNPGSYAGIPDREIPADIRSAPTPIVKSMYWDDRCLAKFFAQVKAEGLFTPDTLFVISADHSALDSVDLQELLGSERMEPLGQIPLIFVSANTKPLQGLNSRKLGSQIDLAPTLLQVMGIQPPANYMGQSLLKDGDGLALGYFHGTLYYKGKGGAFSTEIAGQPIEATDTRLTALRKWFNNLYSANFIANGYGDLYPGR